ncbi:site-specific DNA-methyltransferase [Belnapia sp. T6]|uniref:Methyltransferase n=1 Tax=Belnapia mucosa TaxID=2804532 RepID=A0ABS1UWZ3_9PROT|nr:DNA methyltransferase [Belnapia mucosa]MBL6453837.1 site-specific DNA-methyltransferase [Belnapia mucosa]
MPEAFADQIRRFDAFGAPSLALEEGGIPYLVNEFWTSAQRQAHSIHEISYRACFKPQLPAFFITRLTEPGDWVFDPFMGRGTTPVEAALLRRRPAGSDVNPLSLVLTRPRLRPVPAERVAEALAAINWRKDAIEAPELLAFYSEATLRRLSALRRWLLRHAPIGSEPDPTLDWIRMVALNRLTGHSAGFFSVYSLPPNQAVSVRSQLRINAARGQTPPDRDVAAIILKKTRSLLSDGMPPAAPEYRLSTAPADAVPVIPDGSVALVVTSPPFLDIVQYAEDNWLRCWFAGIDGAGVAIARHRTEAAWQAMVRDCLAEMARILRPGGHVAFEVGEVRRGSVLLERLVWEAADGLPFRRLFVMVNRQAFTKTANCWGVRNNSGGTNTNRIILLQRAKT